MIKLPAARELQELTRFQKPLSVTLYIPYMAANAATNPMQIALKDALKQAEGELKAAGATEKIVRKTLRPGWALATEESAFWPHYHESLAIFLGAGLFQSYRLPADAVALNVHVGQGFDLRPLINVLAEDKAFAVLVLDHHATQLYIGDRYHLAAAPLEGFPADMGQTLNIDEFPSCRELHAIAPAYTGKGSEGYHSQYNVAEVDKQLLLEFFRVIDRRIHRYITDRKLPLVIAGVKYILPIYRKASTYGNLLPAELKGSFRRTSLSTLRDRAWELVRQPAPARA